MKKYLIVLPAVLFTGCNTNEEKDDRICLDYGSFTFMREKCTPFYGTLICMDQEVTEVYCKLYDEGVKRNEP